jgi:hypothetical protein
VELLLLRQGFGAKSTEGELFIDGAHECWTLEDVVRAGPKVDGATAIPCGRFKVIVNDSTRFKRKLPLLVNVPGFDGIRIHRGNTDIDTHGCILVGDVRTSLVDDFIGESAHAEIRVVLKIEEALKHGEVWITVGEDHGKKAA